MFKQSEKYFPTALQQFQYFDKYSRFRYDLGRRETWVETVDRAVSYLKELSEYKLDNTVYEKIRKAILNMEVMPSMRLLAMAGDATRQNEVSVFNCFRDNTKFITTTGIKSFKDFNNGEVITVLSHDGTWNDATVRYYGEQEMVPLHFTRGRHTTNTIHVTKNHRWILSNNKETTELKTGDKVLSSPHIFNDFVYEDAEPNEQLYWLYGYVYGDGSKIKDSKGNYKYSMVRLCGNDATTFANRFEEMGFKTSSPNSIAGDIIAYTGTYLPNPVVDSPELIRAFVAGYLAADGAKNSQPTHLSDYTSITTYNMDSARFIEICFPIAGITIFGIDDLSGTETNFGKRKFCKRYRISTNTRNKTNRMFRAGFESDKSNIYGAWCLEVENTKSFVLDVGVSTGNCSFTGVDSIKTFAETIFIAMSGCGVGFSVEKKYVNQLPDLPQSLVYDAEPFLVPDSSEGWYEAILHLMINLYRGRIPKFDYSNIRPYGAVLKTKGGRASGPEVLKETIGYIIEIFGQVYNDHWDGSFLPDLVGCPTQTKLHPIQVHDIMCSIGNCAISGGTRRTAMLSQFDIDDNEMRNAKNNGGGKYRWIANNSAVWNENLTQIEFLRHMSDMFYVKNGEPGIFSLASSRTTTPFRRDASKLAGTNPCGEVALRNHGFCNLSAVVARPNDTAETLTRKVKLATIIGTIQSVANNFPLLNKDWGINGFEERLLGVDITGQMDAPVLFNNTELREILKNLAVDTNKEFADKLGINQSVAVTCVKPSGNTSVLVNCASGMHPRWSKYYARNVRVSTSSPIFKMIQDQGIPFVPENGQDWPDVKTVVVKFPVKSPDEAITKDDMTAMGMLEAWRINKVYWTEHNPSASIYYEEDEILDIVNWLWYNKDIVGGLTFFPKLENTYKNPPYETVTKEEYEKIIEPVIDWSKLPEYENEDYTEAAQTLACAGGNCDI